MLDVKTTERSSIEMNVELLIQYGLEHDFFQEEDQTYMRNRLCDFLGLEGFQALVDLDSKKSITQLLKEILEWAYEHGKVVSTQSPYSELYDTALMNIMLPRPSDINKKFQALQKISSKEAMDWYYAFSKASDYIKMDRISKNKKWKVPSIYGDIDITINLSKPEKDPKAIEASAHQAPSGYPLCLLCYENEGYAGRMDHPARHSHRVINIELNQEPWFIQYSPYGYYTEHAIIVNKSHRPMKISKSTFIRLADFLDQYDHYFIGSNADLPLVGGSLLSHDHYQGGHYTMPMVGAEPILKFELKQYLDVEASWLKWPMSVIRLKSKNKEALVAAAEWVRKTWAMYSDDELDIHANTESIKHHTITPIMRKNNLTYELDLVLRDNRKNEQYPEGIFHPHKEIHPIKKENIGLIEVMGLAVLPARLDFVIHELADALTCNLTKEDLKLRNDLREFSDLYEEMLMLYKGSHTPEMAVKTVVGQTFVKGLEHCGVFKLDGSGMKGMQAFVEALNG